MSDRSVFAACRNTPSSLAGRSAPRWLAALAAAACVLPALAGPTTDPAESSCNAADGIAVANGAQTELITVTLIDADGVTPVPGQTGVTLVVLVATDPLAVTIDPVSTESDVNGRFLFNVSSSVAQDVEFEAADGAITITDTATVAFRPDLADSLTSTLVATDGDAVADQLDAAVVRLTLRNSFGDVLEGHMALLGTTFAPNPGEFITITAANGGITDVNGQVDFSIRSNRPRANAVVQAVDLLGLIVVQDTETIDFLDNVSDSTNTVVAATDATAIADGVDAGLVTVTLRNGVGGPGAGNPVPGRAITLTTVAGSTEIRPVINGTPGAPGAPGTTDASGVVVFQVRSTLAQSVVCTARDGGTQVGQTAAVLFSTAGTNSSTSSLVVAGSPVASGAFATVTVTLRDANNIAVPNHPVTLDAFPAGFANAPAPPPGEDNVSDADGTVRFRVSSIQAGSITVSARDTFSPMHVTIAQTGAITFLAGDPLLANSSLATPTIPPNPNVNVNFPVVVTVRDANNNPIAGRSVTLAPNPPNANVFVTGTPANTNASGVVTFQARSTVVQSVTLRAAVAGPGAINIDSASISVVGSASTNSATSTLAVADDTLIANGIEAAQVTVTLRDAFSNPVAGHVVELIPVCDYAGLVTIPTNNIATNASGQAVFSATTCFAQHVLFVARDTQDGITVQTNESAHDATYGPGPTATTTSERTSPTTASVNTPVNIRIVLRDDSPAAACNATSNVIPGQTVRLSSVPPGFPGLPLDLVTDNNGRVDFSISTPNTGPATFVARAVQDGVDLPQFSITFNTTQINAAASTVDVNPSSAAVSGLPQGGADGVVVTVRLVDTTGVQNPVPGQNVTLTADDPTGVTIGPSVPAQTDNNGTVTFRVTSTRAAPVVLRATAAGQPLVDFVTATFNPGPPDTATSTLEPNNVTLSVNSPNLFTLTVRDQFGNAISGVNATLFTASPGITAPASGPSAADGRIEFTVTATLTANGVQFQGRLPGNVPIGNVVSVNFVTSQVSPVNSLVEPVPGRELAEASNAADPDSPGIICQLLVTLRDANVNPAPNAVPDRQITLAPAVASGALSIRAAGDNPLGPNFSNALGQCLFEIRSTQTGDFEFFATDTASGVAIIDRASVTFTPSGGVSASNSTVNIAPGFPSNIRANTTTKILVQLRDGTLGGNPVAGICVQLLPVVAPEPGFPPDPGRVTITPDNTHPNCDAFEARTDGEGRALFTVTSSQSTTPTTPELRFRAVIESQGNLEIAQRAAITVFTDVTDTAESTIVTTDGTARVGGVVDNIADPATFEDITVTLRDVFGNAAPQRRVSLRAVSDNVKPATIRFLNPANGQELVPTPIVGDLTNDDGIARFRVRSNGAEVYRFEAIDAAGVAVIADTNDVGDVDRDVVTFTPGAPNRLHISVNPAPVVRTDQNITLVVQVRDEFENVAFDTLPQPPITLELLKPGGCDAALLSSASPADLNNPLTLTATAGIANFNGFGLRTDLVCASYRIRATSPGLTAADSTEYSIVEGTNLKANAAIIVLADSPDARELRVSYTITGAESIAPFTIRYGIDLRPGFDSDGDGDSDNDLESEFDTFSVSDANMLRPGFYSNVRIADVRDKLDAVRFVDKSTIVVEFDSANAVTNETDETDNLVISAGLKVDLRASAVQLDGNVASVRYEVDSPADVGPFFIWIGLDRNNNGVLDPSTEKDFVYLTGNPGGTLQNDMAPGLKTIPPTDAADPRSSLKFDFTAILQQLRKPADAPFTILARIDGDDSVTEIDGNAASDNNLASSAGIYELDIRIDDVTFPGTTDGQPIRLQVTYTVVGNDVSEDFFLAFVVEDVAESVGEIEDIADPRASFSSFVLISDATRDAEGRLAKTIGRHVLNIEVTADGWALKDAPDLRANFIIEARIDSANAVREADERTLAPGEIGANNIFRAPNSSSDENSDVDGDGLTRREEDAGIDLSNEDILDGRKLAIVDQSGTPIRTPPDVSATRSFDTAVDSDGDGLDDNVEHEIGTNPNGADTDGDGLTDGEEVLGFEITPDSSAPGTKITVGTNPQQWDTDNDGLSDLEERNGFKLTRYAGDSAVFENSDPDNPGVGISVVRVSSNPTSADTDGDGLTDWEEVNTYARTADDDGSVPSIGLAAIAARGEQLLQNGVDGNGEPVFERIGDGKGVDNKPVRGVRTDPTRADSDGDGIPDADDPAPQINPEHWGYPTMNPNNDPARQAAIDRAALLRQLRGLQDETEFQTQLLEFDQDGEDYNNNGVLDASVEKLQADGTTRFEPEDVNGNRVLDPADGFLESTDGDGDGIPDFLRFNEATLEGLFGIDFSNNGDLNDGFDAGGIGRADEYEPEPGYPFDKAGRIGTYRIRGFNQVGGDGELDVADSQGNLIAADNCPQSFNPRQLDFDGDGLGDDCDNDLDNDGVPNNLDGVKQIPGGGTTTAPPMCALGFAPGMAASFLGLLALRTRPGRRLIVGRRGATRAQR